MFLFTSAIFFAKSPMVLKLETAKSFTPLTTLLVILLTVPTTAFTALPTYLPIQLKNPIMSPQKTSLFKKLYKSSVICFIVFHKYALSTSH